MSRTITVAEYATETQTASPVDTQTLAWNEVMEVLGYPASWAEGVRAALAAEGKDIDWTVPEGDGNH